MLDLALDYARSTEISLSLDTGGLIALVAGVLILIFPSLLSRIVAAYLILVGLTQLLDLRL